MTTNDWHDVDVLLTERFVRQDPALDKALAANAAGGLPPIDVSPPQGKLLHLLAKISGARRILEIGTLGGYSTIWLARALPDGGELTTCEFNPVHAEVAVANIAHAGLSDRVDVRVGAALDTLATLTGPYDFVFIDADKPNNANYVHEAVRLSRPGTVIVVDNVVRAGHILDAEPDQNARGALDMFDLVAAHPALTATTIQTVGGKGWDGFTLIRVNG
ncbi:MAG: O-methyltransferase family protein [Frankiales bacterium]|nr:O-methyltransferase family protein [Frankiales bacterium]